jgi:uncharacterized membrane protein YdbT with pleckstrin-like domain
MRYIERILQPGEKVLYSGTIHWIVYSTTFLLLVLAGAALIGSTQAASEGAVQGLRVASGLIFIAAIVTFIPAWYQRWTTEIDVTDHRIVYKSGFIRRHTVEMNMDKVESIDVDQSIMGRIFGYGDITVHGTGEGWETLRRIAHPLRLRNSVTAR